MKSQPRNVTIITYIPRRRRVLGGLLEPRSRYQLLLRIQILLSVATTVLVLLIPMHSPSGVARGTFREEHSGVGVGLEPKGSLLAEICASAVARSDTRHTYPRRSESTVHPPKVYSPKCLETLSEKSLWCPWSSLTGSQEALFGLFRAPHAGQFHGWSVARTPFRTVSRRSVLGSSSFWKVTRGAMV